MQVLKTVLVGSFIAAASPLFAADAAPAALTPAQQDEVRTLVKEVLADADTRSSLANGMTAGIDNSGKVFLRSEDDKFGMNIGGKMQFRYDYNNKGGKVGNNSDGFDLRRVELDINGHLGDPRVEYRVLLGTQLAAAADANAIGVKEAYGQYEIQDGLTVRAGKFTLPYSRESLISSGSQVAVERSSVDGYFSLGRAEGIQLQWTDGNNVNLRLAVSDGANSNSSPAFADAVNVAAAGRADILLGAGGNAGLGDFNDNFALFNGNGKQGLLVGLAGYFEDSNSTALPAIENRFGATADATFKVANIAFYGAAFIAGSNNTGNGSAPSPMPWGALAQVDVAVANNVDVFAQYNFINDDSVSGTAIGSNNDLQELVAGVNYHLNSHVKLTGDVAWVFAGAPAFNSPFNTNAAATSSAYPAGGAFVTQTGANNDQVVVRLQAQVSF